jgi:hypothetical protein
MNIVVHVCMHARIRECMHARMRECMHACNACMRVCICIYVRMHTYMDVHVNPC